MTTVYTIKAPGNPYDHVTVYGDFHGSDPHKNWNVRVGAALTQRRYTSENGGWYEVETPTADQIVFRYPVVEGTAWVKAIDISTTAPEPTPEPTPTPGAVPTDAELGKVFRFILDKLGK
jgi:hypothetical protein